MSADIGAALGAQKFTFSLDPNLAQGAVQLDPNSHPELLATLADASANLPPGDVILVGEELSAAPGKNITVGPAKVGFSADLNAALALKQELQEELASNDDLRKNLLAHPFEEGSSSMLTDMSSANRDLEAELLRLNETIERLRLQ